MSEPFFIALADNGFCRIDTREMAIDLASRNVAAGGERMLVAQVVAIVAPVPATIEVCEFDSPASATVPRRRRKRAPVSDPSLDTGAAAVTFDPLAAVHEVVEAEDAEIPPYLLQTGAKA